MIKQGRELVGFSAVALTATLFLAPTAPFAHTLEEFQELCRAEAGLKLHETAENVEGIVVPLNLWGPGPYAWGLVKGGYRFIEVQLGWAGPTYERYYTQGKGYYRHTLEAPGHPDCRPFENTLGPLAAGAKLDLHALYGSKCLATKKIEAPTAPYRIVHQVSKWKPTPEDEADREARRWQQRPGDIIHRRTRYTDATERKVYADFNLFEFVSKVSGVVATKTICPEQEDTKWNRPSTPETALRPPPYTSPPPLELQAFGQEMPLVAMMLLPPPSADKFFELVKQKPPAPEAEAARRAAEAEFEELCRAQAGTRIYQTVENVRGFLDATSETSCTYCQWGITEMGFDFVEHRVSEKVDADKFLYKYVKGPGLYRYALEAPDHPKCDLFYQRWSERTQRGLPLDPMYKGKCVVAWPIQEPESQFKVITKEEKTVTDTRQIYLWYTGYTDISGQTIYAEHRRYRLIPFDVPGDPMTGRRANMKTCPKGSEDFSRTKPNKVFVPPPLNVGK